MLLSCSAARLGSDQSAFKAEENLPSSAVRGLNHPNRLLPGISTQPLLQTTAIMAKNALAKDQFVKLIVGAGQASPSPPVGPALGSKGVKSMDFCKVSLTNTEHHSFANPTGQLTIFES